MIFLRPWNENALTKQKEQTNKKGKSDLIGLSNGNKGVWILVG